MTEPWGAPRSYGWGQRPGGGGGGARAWLWLGSLASQPLRLPLLLPTWEPSARGASEARPLCQCSGAPASHHGIALCAHAPGTHALMGVFCVPGCLPPHLRTIRSAWDARYSLCLTHSYLSARTHRRRPGERLPFPAGLRVARCHPQDSRNVRVPIPSLGPSAPPPQVSSGLRPLCSQGPLAPGHCQTAGVQTDMGTRTPAGQIHACTLKEVHTQAPAPLAPLDQGILPASSCGPMEAELRAVATGPQSHLPGGNGGETQAVQHVPTRAWRLSRVLL